MVVHTSAGALIAPALRNSYGLVFQTIMLYILICAWTSHMQEVMGGDDPNNKQLFLVPQFDAEHGFCFFVTESLITTLRREVVPFATVEDSHHGLITFDQDKEFDGFFIADAGWEHVPGVQVMTLAQFIDGGYGKKETEKGGGGWFNRFKKLYFAYEKQLWPVCDKILEEACKTDLNRRVS